MENTYDIETYIEKLEGELVRVCRECGFPVTSVPKEEAAFQTAPSISLIRHEYIEPQSIAAYQVFVASCQEMYRIGAAVELARLGYKFEKL